MWVRERKWAKMLHRALCGKASSQISHFSSQVIQNELRKMIHTESVFSVMLFLFICSDVAAVSNISASCLHQWNKLQDNEKEAAIEDLLFLTVNVVAFLSHNEGKWIGYYLRPISTYGRFQIFRALQEMSVSTGCSFFSCLYCIYSKWILYKYKSYAFVNVHTNAVSKNTY